MKILQVVHSFPPYTGGIENHTYNLVKELVVLGNKVEVITAAHPKAKAIESIKGFKVRRYFSLNAPWFSSVRYIPFLAFRLLFEDADLYCSHGYGSLMPFCTALAAFIKRKPFIFTLHGYPKQKGISGLLQAIYKIFLASFFLRIARKVITVTDANVQEISKEVDQRKIVIIPNGVDEKKFYCKEKIGKQRGNEILYVGRLDRYKGIDSLIRAFAKLKEKSLDARLRIVGSDEGVRGELEALARDLGVDVEFTEVEYGRMREVYERATAVVLPSHYEGLSLILLEAIACERPTLSTPVGGAPKLFAEVYGEHAGKFLFKSEEELSEKLANILENKREYAEIAETARAKLIKRYSWKEVARRTLKLYEGAQSPA
jgi:glycosyltransferase involved in cell wall biosynthesis